MKVQEINNTNRNYNTNFGAKIVGNLYLRGEAQYIAKNGTMEEKSKLLNFLKIIRNDKSFDTFEMKPTSKYDSFPSLNPPRLCEYIFILDGGKTVYKDKPFCNDSLNFNKFGGDKHFVSELGFFIKEHYGEDVYNIADKNKPEYVQKFLDEQEAVQTQLKTDIRDTLDLAPLNYMIDGDGKKIPAKGFLVPDDDYVC